MLLKMYILYGFARHYLSTIFSPMRGDNRSKGLGSCQFHFSHCRVLNKMGMLKYPDSRTCESRVFPFMDKFPVPSS